MMRYPEGFMNLSRRVVMALVLSLLASTSLALAAQGEQKIGVVDYGRIFKQMPETKKAEQAMQAASNQTKTEIEKLESDFQAAIQAYLKQKGSLSKAVQDQKQKELQLKEQSIKKTVAEKSGLLAKKEKELSGPIYQKINQTVQAVAQKEGYGLIFDKTAMVYGDAAYDITIKVLDQLNIK
jgi:outer membrane protein